MKSNESGRDIKQTGKPEKNFDREIVKDIEAAPELETLAQLHNSLRLGESPLMPAQQSFEAAGMLGNQNVISLMQQGANVKWMIDEGSSSVDTQGLAEVLSGPPDGPVNAMETLM